MNGKGDKPRPFSVNREEFESNWERVFGNKNIKQQIKESNEANIRKRKINRGR